MNKCKILRDAGNTDKYSEVKLKKGFIADLYCNEGSSLYGYQINDSRGHFEAGAGGFKTVYEMLVNLKIREGAP